MVRTLQEFENYFAQFATDTANFGLRSYVFGEHNDFILAQKQADFRYPCLILETPQLFEDTDANYKWHTRLLVLFNNGNQLGNVEYKADLDEAKRILKAVLLFMRHDTQNISFIHFQYEFDWVRKGQMLYADDCFGVFVNNVVFTSWDCTH